MVIISDSNNPNYDGNLSTPNGFRRVESYNLGSAATTGSLILSSTRYIEFDFASAGLCQGVVLCLCSTAVENTYGVKVTLQEYNGSVWNIKATASLSASDIFRKNNTGTGREAYEYAKGFVPFVFDTPYAVTTGTGKYRLAIVRDATYGNLGAHYLITSDATNPFYAVWCDNNVSFTDDDTLIIKDPITIDKTASIGSFLGRGTTDLGICAIGCRQLDVSLDNMASLRWQENPTSSYTFTIKGAMIFGHRSGFRIGSKDNPIPANKQAHLLFDIPDIGTTKISSIISTNHNSISDFWFYGEIPTFQRTTLTADAPIGQKVIQVEDETDWQAGDQVVIGKQNVVGQGVTTIHEIASVSGKTITLTANLATNIRKAGGTVVRFNGYGIKISGLNNTNYGNVNPRGPRNFVVSGCEFVDTRLYPVATNYYYIKDDAAFHFPYTFQDCSVRFTSTNMTTFVDTCFVPKDGVLINRVNTFRGRINSSSVAYFNRFLKSGYFEISNCVCISNYTSTNFNHATATRVNAHDNRFENSSRYGANFQGRDSIFKNNYFWGISALLTSNYYAIGIGQILNPIEISGNKVNKSGTAIVFNANTTSRCFDQNLVLGDEEANTTDISVVTGATIDYEMNNPTGIETVSTEYFPDTGYGSRLRFTDNNGVLKNDINYTTNGMLVRTGDGLPDTTTRTSGTGKYALRFEPTADVLSWEQMIPTGNIKDKTMVVTAFLKIKSENFYQGDHLNPTIRVIYDGNKTESSSAIDTTDWQRVTVTITPKTTTGKITVFFEGYSEVEGEDAWFYLDDVSVLYPAGVQLDLGGLDIWDSGLPVTPTIATNISAMDVWSVDKSLFITPTTMGGHLSSLKNSSLIIDGEVIV